LDVFGYTQERREERALAQEYQSAVAGMLPTLNSANLAAALAFARVPEQIRGFGHVKARSLIGARTQWKQLVLQFYAEKAQEA
jgi:indolepyruvate ferredoxin oxidoreductase